MLNDIDTRPVKTGAKYTLRLPSKPAGITLLESFAEEIAGRQKINAVTLSKIITCLNEAVTNAITHGNKTDVQKDVVITAHITSNQITWTVVDEGGGFDHDNLADPTALERLESLSGRGVFLMKHLADQCRFNAKGNKITLQFNL